MSTEQKADRLDGRERPGGVIVAVLCLIYLAVMAFVPIVVVLLGQAISAASNRDTMMLSYASVWGLIGVLLTICAWRLFWGQSASGMMAIMIAVPSSLLMLMALIPVMGLPFMAMAFLTLGSAALMTAMVWTKPVRKFLGAF